MRFVAVVQRLIKRRGRHDCDPVPFFMYYSWCCCTQTGCRGYWTMCVRAMDELLDCCLGRNVFAIGCNHAVNIAHFFRYILDATQ